MSPEGPRGAAQHRQARGPDRTGLGFAGGRGGRGGRGGGGGASGVEKSSAGVANNSSDGKSTGGGGGAAAASAAAVASPPLAAVPSGAAAAAPAAAVAAPAAAAAAAAAVVASSAEVELPNGRPSDKVCDTGPSGISGGGGGSGGGAGAGAAVGGPSNEEEGVMSRVLREQERIMKEASMKHRAALDAAKTPGGAGAGAMAGSSGGGNTAMAGRPVANEVIFPLLLLSFGNWLQPWSCVCARPSMVLSLR